MHELGDLSINKDYHVRCSDQNEPISGFKLPRGKGGVAIFWPNLWSSRIKKLSDGNERIIAIEIQGQVKICLINVYMPTNNSSVNSHLEYTECLDILHNMISKFRQTHKMIVCGDFNGTLLDARPYNKHDYLLQAFVNCQGLKWIAKSEHTFFHHAGTSSSQIDYVLSSDLDLLQNYQIGGRDSENSSSHVKVACDLLVPPLDFSNIPQSKTVQSIRKLQWEKIDHSEYKLLVDMELEKHKCIDHSVDSKLTLITNICHKAAKKAVPSKVIRLKGPTWKASPTVKCLLGTCKEKYKLWKESGKTDIVLRAQNIKAKRNLRRQLRKEKI